MQFLFFYLWCSDPKICKSVIKLLCFLSEGGSQEVSRFLLNKNKLQLFVSFLEDDSKGDVQAATAGILANLPASDSKLTAALIEYEALPAIIKVILGTVRSHTRNIKLFLI
jgi:hypothetical protein